MNTKHNLLLEDGLISILKSEKFIYHNLYGYWYKNNINIKPIHSLVFSESKIRMYLKCTNYLLKNWIKNKYLYNLIMRPKNNNNNNNNCWFYIILDNKGVNLSD